MTDGEDTPDAGANGGASGESDAAGSGGTAVRGGRPGLLRGDAVG